MILRRLYSNQTEFKTLIFERGINLILGGTFEPQDEGAIIGEHNVGKSLSFEIIDFCLLGRLEYRRNLTKLSPFLQEYAFFLEIKLPEGTYLTIRRSISIPDEVKYLLHDDDVEFESDKNFHSLALSEAIPYFNSLLTRELGFDCSFRELSSRFIRFSTQFLDPLIIEMDANYNKRHIDWLPGALNAFSVPFDRIEKYYKNKRDLKGVVERKKAFSKIIKVRANSKASIEKRRDTINKEIERMRATLESRKKEVKELSFYHIDKAATESVIREIDSKLISLNERRYYLKRKLASAQEALKLKLDYDFNHEVKDLYHEVGLTFNERISKSYQNLVQFNKDLVEERATILREQEAAYKAELRRIEKEIEPLDKRKQEKLSMIRGTDVRLKVEKAEIEIEEIGRIISDLEARKSLFVDFITTLERIEEFETENESIEKEYIELREGNKALIDSISQHFADSTFAIIDASVRIDLDATKPMVRIVDPGNIRQDTTYGETYTKIACIVYDSSILKSYADCGLPFIGFALHDNAFASMAIPIQTRLKENLLLTFAAADCQYIFTNYHDGLPGGFKELVANGSIHLVESLYSKNDFDYSNTLFRKNFAEDSTTAIEQQN